MLGWKRNVPVWRPKSKNQYDRINAMKLDKSVFEATMMQLNTLQNDLHEIRADIRELLKCQGPHK